MTQQARYQVFFLVLYSMGLRLSKGLHLSIHDIDSQAMQIHVRDAKGGNTTIMGVLYNSRNSRGWRQGVRMNG